MLERLHKVLARAGVAALRPAEDMILAGRVTVNGRVVRELGARADPETDVIAVDGQIIEMPLPSTAHRYVMLNKPTDVISTARDTHGRRTVVGLVPSDRRLFPVGRLDANSEGLILLTDDGDLAQRMTHPRYEVEKEYRVLLNRAPTVEDLRRWRSGVELEGEMTLRAWVEVLERTPEGVWVRVVMREGRKRQIREIARLLGYEVLRLIRVREGPVSLSDLQPGQWRELTADEVRALQLHVRHIPLDESGGRVSEREAQQKGQRTSQPERSGSTQQSTQRPRRAPTSEASRRPPVRQARSSGKASTEQRAPVRRSQPERPAQRRNANTGQKPGPPRRSQPPSAFSSSASRARFKDQRAPAFKGQMRHDKARRAPGKQQRTAPRRSGRRVKGPAAQDGTDHILNSTFKRGVDDEF